MRPEEQPILDVQTNLSSRRGIEDYLELRHLNECLMLKGLRPPRGRSGHWHKTARSQVRRCKGNFIR